jgi:DNA-binding beta-propeller fold protein YncE
VERAAVRRFLEDHEGVGRQAHRAKSFAPSAIGVDPVTGQIYLLTTAGPMLVVLDAAADSVLEVVALNRDVHAQPEGLAFDADGSLYISNEGRSTQATLHRFGRRTTSAPR